MCRWHDIVRLAGTYFHKLALTYAFSVMNFVGYDYQKEREVTASWQSSADGDYDAASEED